MTTEVVPSPTSLSCISDSCTSTRAAGCSTSKLARMVAPSLVIVTSPRSSTSILSRPIGPSEVLTTLATESAAVTAIRTQEHRRSAPGRRAAGRGSSGRCRRRRIAGTDGTVRGAHHSACGLPGRRHARPVRRGNGQPGSAGRERDKEGIRQSAPDFCVGRLAVQRRHGGERRVGTGRPRTLR